MNKIVPQKWPAYNKITENLYLGRLPLKNNNDQYVLHKEGIGAVLSVIEKFENHSKDFFILPVSPSDWKSLAIDHLQIETPDFHPLSLSSFQRGVSYIESQIKKGKKVYIHCKAGRGRSAVILVAYLRKNFPEQFPTTAECLAFVKNRRHLLSIGKDQLESLEVYLSEV